MKRTLVLGGPGAGKTERLLRVVEETIARGVRPDRIAFVGFTKASCADARRRAEERFGLSPKDLPHFRTIHSLCFRGLGMGRKDVVTRKDLDELSDVVGEPLDDEVRSDAPAQGRLLTLDHYARVTGLGLRRAWEDHGGEVDWHRLKRFSLAYASFKRDRGLYDFTDMLSLFAQAGPPVDAEVAIVDEAQDLARLQHDAVGRAFGSARELWMAGDDDQAIHAWAGADEGIMFESRPEIEILTESRRLPRSVAEIARSIITRVGGRREKNTRDRGVEGRVNWCSRIDELDLGSGSWLLLARTRSQLAGYVNMVTQQGIPFVHCGSYSVDQEHVRAIRAYEALRAGKRIEPEDARVALRHAGIRRDIPDDSTVTAKELGIDFGPIWHDALIRIPLASREHYLGALRRGEKLDADPRVRVDTIHAAKGLEADQVCLLTDLTHRTRRALELDPDSEHRVFYVGATRGRETLSIVVPSSAGGYTL